MSMDDLAPTASTSSPIGPRWWPVPAAIGLGVVLQIAAAIGFSENLSYLTFASLFIIWPLSAFLLLLWWTFWSRLAWRTRFAGLLAVVAAFGLFVVVFRFDEFDGAMAPKFSFRWRPTAEARAKEFFQERLKSGESADPAGLSIRDETSLAPTPEDSPEYRGQNRDGIILGKPLRMDWDAKPPKKLWRHPIGLGWGSFAVFDRQAWTIEQRGADELVVCYDVETGDELWSHTDTVRFESVQGGVGPRTTPTIHEGKSYSVGGTGILNCLDAKTGQRIWSRNILDDAGSANLSWGQAGSPLIVEDLVIVSPGCNDTASKAKKSAVIAYRRDNGEKVWTMGDRIGSYASPQLATLGGQRQVLIFDGLGLMALSPEDGNLLWQFDWTNSPQVNAAQPLIVDEHTVLIGAGYAVGAALIDVTKTESGWLAKEIWTSKQFKLKFNSAVRHGDYVYGLDEGLLTCLSLKDGRRQWKQGRYGYGQMLLAKDRLLILSEEGDVVLIPASAVAPRELARFHAIDGKTWNNPALARGRLLVRNSEEAACYDLR